jgi:hypothetical protein
MKYITSYNQELGATEIRDMIEKTIPDLKELLDNK